MNNLLLDSLKKLKGASISNPELDLRILLNHCSKVKKNIILSNFNDEYIDIPLFNNLLAKRLQRKSVAKIINKKHFWKYTFYVDENVLDPRPETELIIEEVLKHFTDKYRRFKVLDFGTGSGCLAISIAKEFPNSKIIALDRSDKALNVAKKNVDLNNVSRQVNLVNTSIDCIFEKFDLIVSNPPYLSEIEFNNTEDEIKKFEPKEALLGGPDGLKFYKIFAKKIPKIMHKNSLFICEIGDKQLNFCTNIFQNSNLKLIKTKRDLQNIVRTLTFSNI